ncbi:hypothetical protein BD309DRAFT_957785 [Dichomitus squalens]|uniref:GmrSD restriction endonucleases N-terminal domain-containing protein n=1 Tax=Dichomitus squalens TaxID=114155 RepID=A0A4V2K4J4_9APHY|nr:hypothetical protein BD309DRAFT_957785 [Dichomitus squalens]TBU56888.1 hypothetical protein BD310DRAFT_930473 [Dichomitus squalens]
MSDYEEDDWDELVEEEVEHDPNRFDLGTCLNAPKVKFYTTKELHGLIHEGVIDLNPPYQREIVWPEAKQMKLLDSLYRNYYVPPVVFAVYTDDEGEKVKCCVDGKQRLTSIQRFFDGQIAYKHHETGKSWWYTRSNARKKSRLEIPDKFKEIFAQKTITCVEYEGLPHLIERDIFQRVQLGVALTAAEKLQAISSPWTEWIGELQSRYVYLEDSLTQNINVAIKRGQDFQLIAGLVYCCDMYPEHSQPLSKNLDKWLSRMDPPKEDFKDLIRSLLSRFWHIADDSRLNFAFQDIQKRVAPAEFVFTGVILYVLRDLPAQDQAQAIYQLRTDIRKKHPDIRLRTDIIRDLWVLVEAAAEGAERKGKQGKKKGRRIKDDEDENMDYDEEYPPRKQRRK